MTYALIYAGVGVAFMAFVLCFALGREDLSRDNVVMAGIVSAFWPVAAAVFLFEFVFNKISDDGNES